MGYNPEVLHENTSTVPVIEPGNTFHTVRAGISRNGETVFISDTEQVTVVERDLFA